MPRALSWPWPASRLLRGIGAQRRQIRVGQRPSAERGMQHQGMLQSRFRLLQRPMRSIEAGLVVEDVPSEGGGRAGLKDSAGPDVIDLQRTRRFLAVEQVLRQMQLRMLVAIAHEGYVERPAVFHPVEATPRRQVVFAQLRRQRDQVRVGLIGFWQDRRPGASAMLGENQRIQLFKVQGVWLWSALQDRLQAKRQALPPERQVSHVVF